MGSHRAVCGKTSGRGRNWRAFLLVAVALCGRAATAQEMSPDECPLVTRQPEQRVLLIISGDEEARAASEACRGAGMAFDVGKFDAERRDYSGYHLIVVGSNGMDYWGRNAERKAPAAFEPLEAFVRNGGHLMVLNTFNGRNMEQLKRFGVVTGFQHGGRYQPAPGLTEVLFAGIESEVPEGDRLQQSGHFSVKQPHIVLLQRGSGKLAGRECVATIPFGRGRLTYTSVEPAYGSPNGYWLVRVMIHWASRGAPVVPGETAPIVYDNRPLPPTEGSLANAREQIHKSFGAALPASAAPKSWAERAALYRNAAEDERDPALRYLLLQNATEAFARGGDPAGALESLDLWTSEFAVPRHAATLMTLQSLSRSTSGAKWQEAARTRALSVIDEALSNRDTETARQLVKLAIAAAEESRNRRWISISRAESDYVEGGAAALQSTAPWFERLKDTPGDPESLRHVGAVQCFLLRDWRRGLSALARCDDESLRTAAELDLANPLDPEDRVQVGDAWTRVARSAAAPERSGAEQRAAHWLSLSLPELTGLRRAAIEQRLQQLQGPPYSLRVVVSRASGETQLVLSPAEIVCEAGANSAIPERIGLGDFSWSPRPDGRLANSGLQRVLPRGVHLSSVRLERVRSRGTVTIESASEERVVVKLAHTGGQVLPHEFTLEFGGATTSK